MPPPLIIVGASARAAAISTIHCGIVPICCDRFGDADLAAIAAVHVVGRYPTGLAAAVDNLPAGDWLYTGALENQPRLVAQIAARRRLLGNSAATLVEVRDPRRVHHVLAEAQLPCPEVRSTSRGLPRDGTWMRKPRHSAGGGQIVAWDANTPSARRAGGWYFQRRVDGQPLSAVYVAATGSAMMLGTSWQRMGRQHGDPAAYCYAGSVSPAELPASALRSVRSIGACLAAAFRLQGLFGVDAVLDANGVVWPIEVNPRYTASVEVVERAYGIDAIALHIAACRGGTLPGAVGRPRRSVGKSIVYARRSLLISEQVTRQLLAANIHPLRPSVADIPRTRTRIPRGSPVATVIVEAETPAAVCAQLDDETRRLTAWIESHCSTGRATAMA